MNTNIPASAELVLRKQVERAVRPVRAGKRRKMLMREELLAHLTALYEEGASRQPNEPAALREALARFGDPAALTSELDAAVSWQERFQFYEDSLVGKCDRWFGFHEGEPLWRVASRTGIAMGLLTLLLALALSILWVFDTERLTDSTKYPLAGKLIVYQGLVLWGFLIAIHATCRALGDAPRGRWLAALWQSLVWVLLFVALAALFWWSIAFRAEAALEKIPFVAAGSFGLLLPLLLFLAWNIRAERAKQRVSREWQSLVIDE